MTDILSIEKLKDPNKFHKEICQFFNDIVATKAIERVNNYFAYKRLAKLSREAEPLPVDPKQLSSYRTRLGTMLEYAISTEIQRILEEEYKEDLYLTFAVVHEYPDFYLRDKDLKKIIKIEMKAVDADSDEQGARFEVLSRDIDPKMDLLLFVCWIWKNEKLPSGEDWEHPSIFSHLVIPAIEIAKERDIRLIETGGKIEGNRILVPSTKNPGTFVDDPGNYGKFWRIMKKDRRESTELTEYIKLFLEFQKQVDKKSPRKRF